MSHKRACWPPAGYLRSECSEVLTQNSLGNLLAAIPVCVCVSVIPVPTKPKLLLAVQRSESPGSWMWSFKGER